MSAFDSSIISATCILQASFISLLSAVNSFFKHSSTLPGELLSSVLQSLSICNHRIFSNLL